MSITVAQLNNFLEANSANEVHANLPFANAVLPVSMMDTSLIENSNLVEFNVQEVLDVNQKPLLVAQVMQSLKALHGDIPLSLWFDGDRLNVSDLTINNGDLVLKADY